MAFTFNGTTPTVINFNGNSIYKVICNGVTVWTASTPFYWFNTIDYGDDIGYKCVYTDGYQTMWDDSNVNYECDECDRLGDTHVNSLGWNHSCGHDHYEVTATANAKGNTKAEIYVTQCKGAGLIANGVTLFDSGTDGEYPLQVKGQYFTVDIVNDTLNLIAKANDGDGYMYIVYIKFYD